MPQRKIGNKATPSQQYDKDDNLACHGLVGPLAVLSHTGVAFASKERERESKRKMSGAEEEASGRRSVTVHAGRLQERTPGKGAAPPTHLRQSLLRVRRWLGKRCGVFSFF